MDAADAFDVAVLDQWGVLHDGTTAYPQAAQAMLALHAAGKHIIVLSNSGKRSDLNRDRIAKRGLPIETVTKVVTSGEALWEDLTEQQLEIAGVKPQVLYPICDYHNDAIDWAGKKTPIEISLDLNETVDAILLMGLTDGTAPDAYDDIFDEAIEMQMPLICSNPDKTSVRDSALVISPGALADRYAAMGGEVVWYGKPYANVYRAVIRAFAKLPPNRFLMVGDSLEHDIGGAQRVGFQSAWIRGGIHAHQFAESTNQEQIQEISEELVEQASVNPPEYSLQLLS